MSDAEKLLDQLQRAVEENAVGVELWFGSVEWEREKAKGVSFVDWAQEILERA